MKEHTQYGTVQYSTVQYSTVQYSTVQYSSILDILEAQAQALPSVFRSTHPSLHSHSTTVHQATVGLSSSLLHGSFYDTEQIHLECECYAPRPPTCSVYSSNTSRIYSTVRARRNRKRLVGWLVGCHYSTVLVNGQGRQLRGLNANHRACI
ncbi:hypothetical protein BCV70DRAFT_22499 [Testicularia cyperi]|uniref:Uncharacterized protein n=1 Tax=Testicularia cyperi TaxID=1882483 RepID=A0A317XZQ1_9BASI|nr:hypothetical protein BCV70DRAFT_22499 [Testicularia cyperi]